MKVHELMKFLSEQDPDTIVVVWEPWSMEYPEYNIKVTTEDKSDFGDDEELKAQTTKDQIVMIRIGG